MAKNEQYELFVEKFKPKLTTDDCYTPPPVMQCVLDYVDRTVMPLQGRRVVQPFKPGGDYQAEDYRDGDVVVDNPPFSILAQIVDFYIKEDIPFFLFAPALTLFNYGGRETVTCIVTHADLTFHNGACINISFLTNMIPGHPAFILDGDFRSRLMEANKQLSKQKRKIVYPDCVTNAAMLGKIASRGISWTVPRQSVQWIRKLDCGQPLFGAGFLLSERAAAERAAAERAAAERAAAERAAAERAAAERAAAERAAAAKYTLSRRELEIQKTLY